MAKRRGSLPGQESAASRCIKRFSRWICSIFLPASKLLPVNRSNPAGIGAAVTAHGYISSQFSLAPGGSLCTCTQGGPIEMRNKEQS